MIQEILQKVRGNFINHVSQCITKMENYLGDIILKIKESVTELNPNKSGSFVK